ncbi:MAG: hypothetical protein KAU21_07650 [Gammaproteobacteria bacterium]|nr:hypothetical protein [Gammaproteobacteria bacterium]
MTNLQTALDARLAALKGKKTSNKQTLVKQNVSAEAIKASLRGAGILDRKDRVAQLVTVK